MQSNLQNKKETTRETNRETNTPATATGPLALIFELLEAVGLSAEAVFDGDAERCPHCLSRVFSEAA